MRTLVTGFGPFSGVSENPSAVLAEKSGRKFQVLEVSYEAADSFVQNLDPERFDCWLMLGVASNRSRVSIERQARNFRSGQDVLGIDRPSPILVGGPETISANLWDSDLIELLGKTFEAEIQISYDAGTFLCNYLTHRGLTQFPNKKIGFLHVVFFDRVSQERQTQIVTSILDYMESSST